MRYLFLLCLIFILETTFGQSFKDNLYHSFGFTYFLDVHSSKAKEFTYTDLAPNENGELEEQTFTGYSQAFGISAITGIYRIRYNLYNFSNSALTISLVPALSISHVEVDAISSDNSAIVEPERLGNGTFNLPILLGFERGLGSQRGLEAKNGYTVKVGYEYTVSPLIYQEERLVPYLNGSWGQMVFVGSYRFLNKKEKFREVNFKFGYGNEVVVPDDIPEVDILASFTARISFIRMIP